MPLFFGLKWFLRGLFPISLKVEIYNLFKLKNSEGNMELNILVATTKEDDAGKIVSYLNSRGYTTDAVFNHRQLAGYMKSYRFLIVLLDSATLNSGAPELFRQIKNIQPLAQVIDMDRNPQTFSVVKSIQEGADDYVVLNDIDDPKNMENLGYVVDTAVKKIRLWKNGARKISNRKI